MAVAVAVNGGSAGNACRAVFKAADYEAFTLSIEYQTAVVLG